MTYTGVGGTAGAEQVYLVLTRRLFSCDPDTNYVYAYFQQKSPCFCIALLMIQNYT